MQSALQLRIQRYGWDRAAADYEQYWSTQIAPAQCRLLSLAALQPGEAVLDVACGTGLVTLCAAEKVGPTGSVTGTDISDRMVALARQRCAAYPNVIFERADADSAALPPASFDAVLCSLGLMYVPDPLQTLRALRRLLRPGGRLVAAVWGRRDRCGWAGIFPVVDARVHTDVCPMFFHLGTGNNLPAAMELAGLRNIVLSRIETRLNYPDARAALGAAFIGGPVAMAYSRFDDDTRAAAHADYLETIEPFRHGQSYSLPGEFVIARAEAPPAAQ
jgi:SAM-dependent methyltransferase